MDVRKETMRTMIKKTKVKSNNNNNKNRQIPAFGNWDMAIENDLPITQYFESALQAGLIRYSSSSSSFSADIPPNNNNNYYQGQRNGNVGENRETETNVKEGGKKQAGNNNGKVFDVTITELPPLAATTATKRRQPDSVKYQQHRRAPKAVDEDLYKIPPELIKQKRRLGFFSRCLVPPCAV